MSAWTASRTAYEATQVLQQAGIASTPALNGPALVEDPQLRHRGFFVDTDHPEVGVKASAGIPLRFSETQLQYTAAPMLGQHNREVFTDLVGMEPEEFERLIRDSVIA